MNHNVTNTDRRPVVRPRAFSMIERTRDLLVAACRGGAFPDDSAGDLDGLLADPLFERLPRGPGGPIQTELFLLRCALASLEELRMGRRDAAVGLLAKAMRAAEEYRPGDGFIDPDDGFMDAIHALTARLGRRGSPAGGSPSTPLGRSL